MVAEGCHFNFKILISFHIKFHFDLLQFYFLFAFIFQNVNIKKNIRIKLCKRKMATKLRMLWSQAIYQSCSQRLRSFWLATGIATSGQVQLRKSAIHGLLVTLHMLRVKSVWLVLVSIYCVYNAIQNQNVVGPGQGSRFPVHDKRDPWGRGWPFI